MEVLFSDEVKMQFSGTKQFVRKPSNTKYNATSIIRTSISRTLWLSEHWPKSHSYTYKPLRWLVLRGLRTLRVRLRRPSGVLPALKIFFHSTILINNVYGAIDNKNVVMSYRIRQNFCKDDGSMVRRTKLLNQLGVTALIESLHNLFETLNSDRSGYGTKLNPQM